MKQEDATLKANALGKDLIGKEAQHKESNQKYTISSVVAMGDEDEENYEVYCFLNPSENNFQTLALREEIDAFLANYKVIIDLTPPTQLMAS